MLKLINILPSAKQHKLRSHLNKHRCLLTSDTSSYGTGRKRYWLQHQPVLGSGGRHYQPAYQQAEFWHFCQTIYQRASRIALPEQEPMKPDLGLVAYGDVGIREHRDDPYAACPAVTINLSTVPTQWGYTAIYDSYEKRRPRRVSEEIHHLPPGAIIVFNSQNPHRVISPDPERWSINLWRIAPACRPYFQSYLENQPLAQGQANEVSFFPQVGEKYYGQERAEGREYWGSPVGLPRTGPR
ncbi:hypothetical protein [Leptothoe sp. PORK10 BA2]|uniref:hypothetical protein n=1 Tax=Leptothoe sp. PORK10 BA2 TaxID=3110254 RepID=UPI002B220139|nr:hypothetical protein [Leptothoe sp. PORK10 BA2]MEA5462638.1 hypothetical protein [Leptothoe sp. PORK10 BA2]